MKLKQATMTYEDANKGTTVRVLVQLWQGVGLCYYKDKYGYNVSHYVSGRYIVRCIPTQERAKEIMQILYDRGSNDWTFTLEDWLHQDNASVRVELKILVDRLRNKQI